MVVVVDVAGGLDSTEGDDMHAPMMNETKVWWVVGYRGVRVGGFCTINDHSIGDTVWLLFNSSMQSSTSRFDAKR